MPAKKRQTGDGTAIGQLLGLDRGQEVVLLQALLMEVIMVEMMEVILVASGGQVGIMEVIMEVIMVEDQDQDRVQGQVLRQQALRLLRNVHHQVQWV